MIDVRSLLVGCFTTLLLLLPLLRHTRQLKAQQATISRMTVPVKKPEQTQRAPEELDRQIPNGVLPFLPPPGMRSFTGRVVNVGGRYLLEDALLDWTYDLDPQDAVRQLEGMTVRLNGALDPSGKILHLERPLRY